LGCFHLIFICGDVWFFDDLIASVASGSQMGRISPPMNAKAKKYIKGFLRWGVAAVGTWYVLSQLSWNDRALVLTSPSSAPQWATVEQGDETSDQLIVRTWAGEKTLAVDRDSVVSEPDRKKLSVMVNGQPAPVLGVDLIDRYYARRLLVQEAGGPTWVDAGSTDYQVTLPHPRVQIGVRHLA
jgi:hypothetical protein